MQIGNYQLHCIETGRFGLDGGAMFGVVPKVLWNKTNPSDDANRIDLAMRALLVVGEGRVILIDCGVGSYWPEKFHKIYAIDHKHSDLSLSLEKLGYQKEDITDVILTHLHFDHVGGAVEEVGEEKKPAFGKARYHVQKEHFQYAQNPTEKDRASFIPETFMPLSKNLNLVEGEKELFPNIHLHLAHGHTPHQQMVRISDQKTNVLYCADLIPTSSHISVPYVMAYDVNPVTTITEKKKILAQAEEENWWLCFEHDPSIALAQVKKTERGYSAGETKGNF